MHSPIKRGDETDADALLRRLEKLALFLLKGQFDRSDQLWSLQVDLLHLQQDIQGEIRASKLRLKTDSSERRMLERLQTIRRHARRFGDAVAWILLNLDRQYIYPLAKNSSVSIPNRDHGTRAMISLAPILSADGWGFPLIHDISDCLRIGDLTFIDPKANTTVELKTRLLDERPSPEGAGRIVEYEAAVLSPSVPPDSRVVEPGSTEQGPTRQRQRRLPDRRAERQVKRLQVARAHQTAECGEVAEIDGSPVLTTRIDSTDHNFEALKRVVRKARRQGYAGEAVEGTFFYCAVYSPEGIDGDNVQQLLEQLPHQVTAILGGDGSFGADSLVIYSIPTEPNNAPELYLPWYLLPLPKSNVVDILNGRMVLFNLVNPAQLAKALESIGFHVSVASDGNALSGGSFILQHEFRDSQGESYGAELHNLELHILEMVMEFRSIEYLLQVAEGMRAALPDATTSSLRRQP